MTRFDLPTRRSFLALGAGLSLTMYGGGAFAAGAPMRQKLVLVVARGAMDGLSLAPPIGDPNYAALRGPIAIPADAVLKLDGTFGLHPKLDGLHRMIQSGQARLAPAVALPQRIRSHFEAQDLLETGGPRSYALKTGWLNRAVQAIQVAHPIQAMSLGAQRPLVLTGPIQSQSWSPGRPVNDSAERVAAVLQDLYANDPLLGPALASGLQTESMAAGMGTGQPVAPQNVAALVATAAKFLTAPDGPSIAVLSLDGFDTHARQGAAEGQLAVRFNTLDQTLTGLQTGLGPAWKDTVVIVATEFGRTARINGTQGTDHGTASALVLAGGAVKPGGMIGDWPTLADNKLFENRDLAPTLDVRSVFKGVLADHMGLDRSVLETAVFPESADAPAAKGLVA